MNNYKYILLLAAIASLAAGCHNSTTGAESDLTISPETGATFKSGEMVPLKVHYPSTIKADSVVYLVDSARVGSLKDSSVFQLKTDSMPLGPRVITAKVFSGGKSQDASTNVTLLPSKAPVAYTYSIVKTYPHDTSSFTEGLVYQDGYLYESAGGYLKPPPGQDVTNQSSLRKVDLATGKVLQKTMLDPAVFAEGIAIVGSKIIQLTYNEKIGYVYDKDSFKRLGTFPNNIGIEGWGMCFDGKKLMMDDKTNRIFFLDKDNYRQTGFIDVYDDKGPVNEINELEYIDGKIYANVWQTNTIIVIEPKTGAVLERIDLTNLYPQDKRSLNADVLNGIAYDTQGKRIFITGKKWPTLYQVKFHPQDSPPAL